MTETIDNKEPGISLARARQEKNLTMDEVAGRLHLSAIQIRLLEDNDYDDLPEATYIKGYIRNYAQLLGLDPVALIAAFTERAYPKKNDTVDLTPASKKNPKVSDESKAIYAIAGIVILVVIVIAIWFGSQSKTESVPGLQAESSSETDQQSDDLFGQGPDDQASDESVADSTLGSDSEKEPGQELQEPEYPASPSANTAPTAIAKVPEPVQETEQPAQQLPGAVKKSAGDSGEETKQETIESNEQTPPQIQQVDELVLFFEQNSWADVRDVNDKKLLYKTISEGRVVSVKGVAPFKVFLGNAEGVKLSFNGKQIDFERYKRGLIARFTVGRN